MLLRRWELTALPQTSSWIWGSAPRQGSEGDGKEGKGTEGKVSERRGEEEKGGERKV